MLKQKKINYFDLGEICDAIGELNWTESDDIWRYFISNCNGECIVKFEYPNEDTGIYPYWYLDLADFIVKHSNLEKGNDCWILVNGK